MKIAKVLAHIAGPSGSGKTHLINQLTKQYPTIVAKDLDEFDELAKEKLNLTNTRWQDYKTEDWDHVYHKRQELMDHFLQRQKRPVVLAGHHWEDDKVLDIPTKNRFMLSTHPITAAWRGYKRSQNEPGCERSLTELPSDIRMAYDDQSRLKSMGYQKKSPQDIMNYIGKEAGILEDIINKGFRTIEKGLPGVQANPVELNKYEKMTSPEVWNSIAGKNILQKQAAHSFTCVMVNVPSDFNDDIQVTIKPADLYTEEEGHGMETEPHVTVLYGLHTNDPADVSKIFNAAHVTSVKLKVKAISIFDAQYYDVLKYDIESDDLQKLNSLLTSKLPYTSKFKKYHPHLTIAYLKKGTGKKYVSDKPLNKSFEASTFVFSPAEGLKVTLPFSATHIMNTLKDKISMIKQALKTERKQVPTADQVSRQPSAVIIQGNQDYIQGNHAAKAFYNDIAAFIRSKGYTVTQTKGEASGKPPGANVWVSHGGINPPKGTKVLNIPQYPRPFMTKALIQALDRVTKDK